MVSKILIRSRNHSDKHLDLRNQKAWEGFALVERMHFQLSMINFLQTSHLNLDQTQKLITVCLKVLAWVAAFQYLHNPNYLHLNCLQQRIISHSYLFLPCFFWLLHLFEMLRWGHYSKVLLTLFVSLASFFAILILL